MFFAFVVFAILGTASAQTFSLGNCKPDIETFDFDKTKFSGTFYLIKKSQICGFDSKCQTYTYNLTKRGNFEIPSNFIVVGDNHEHDKAKNDHKHTIKYVSKENDNENLQKGIINVTPGFITDPHSFFVLGTDYKTYAVGYWCLDAFDGKLEYVWIVTRSMTPDNATIAKAEEELTKRNINIPLVNEVQDC